MVFTVILQCDTHPGTRLCYDKNEIQKRKKSITFFFGILEVGLDGRPAHLPPTRSLGKENHFKKRRDVGKRICGGFKSQLSRLLPKPLEFQSSRHYRATSSTHTWIRVCATSVTSIKIYFFHGVYAGLCS